ncbi:interferon-induced GTP-binding protein Mx1 isoform X2 [Saccopteryx leptura]|uniref:interferon-induced GTP-binding protein Mx1 isoform X2 n=2 Tax=Saccopteryx leptura TaxID=249018 RepID=UPI00339CAF95
MTKRRKKMVYADMQIAKPDSTSASNHQLPNGNAEMPEKNLETHENSLCEQYEEKVRPCIDLIDSLRALGVEQDLALPAIAVIGDQSSGKSSVLEALSGVALPRGSGIVTRCPLVLKLRKVGDEDGWAAKVSYRDLEMNISSASEVEKEIRKAQDVIAGEGVGISHELISLEVSSPHIPDLTLIDLPGITRVAVGNQPADIGHQIKALIKKYICKNETINLVVVPSNVDIATTEALSMAQEVDPEGDRTIGILTKPDLVDRGTEDKVVDVVRNLIFHLKKGYMVVKCRGQQEIQDHVSLTEALSRERAFFEDHPYFRELLEEGRATIPCLADRLTTELIAHICKCLPLLENQIKTKQQTITEDLDKCGSDIPEDETEKMFFLIDKINTFNQDIRALVEGEEAVGEYNTRLFTRIRAEFCRWGTVIERNFKKGSEDMYKQMEKFENQYRGRELPGFVNYKTFEVIIREEIKTLEEPAMDMLNTVIEMVQLAFTDIAQKNFKEFFNLHRTCKSKIEDIRLEQEKEAVRVIRLHFQMEQIVYCQDQVYQNSLHKVREEETKEKNNTPKYQVPIHQSSNVSLDEICQHLMAYHKEATNRLSTHIPLIIQFFILQSYNQHLEKSMLQLLQDKEKYSWLLKEHSDTSDKRKFLKEQLVRLTKARRQLAKFPG